jgi:hypothetical protein
VLDDDEGHTVACGQRIQQPFAGVKTARRSADRDDREICATAGGQGLPDPTLSLSLGSMRATSRHAIIFL